MEFHVLPGVCTAAMSKFDLRSCCYVKRAHRQPAKCLFLILLLYLQRIMGVLSVEVPNGASSSRRKGAAPPARASIPVTLAGPAAAAELDADDFSGADAAAGSVGGLRAMEMDPEAAAMWKKFLAGSRAMDVPMWDNRMVEDLPKVG